ncbi:MAG: hypothetical protein Q4B50_03795 [Bacillota bacterium]|nr:hypothetical protein [Bacillota bacterium]
MLNSIPCPSRRTILLSLFGLILLIISLQWLSRENLYEFLHEAEDAELIQYMENITMFNEQGDFVDYEDIPKDSPLYQEVMEILKSVTIRPILGSNINYIEDGYYFRFCLCAENDGYVTSSTIFSSKRMDIEYRYGDRFQWRHYRIVDEGRLKELYPLLGVPFPEQP